ncbi:hypothetical protein G5B38_19830 (plasmid) [Pseudohalocynthiibacter aestuariivivens]|nr:hypothetical protein [Pseudohalocynthiibacter aestuariivivens]QIE47875.1 hypothetical protein G5B38_19830 [Pseudohalocynthiibacter aestuariivivens]
MTKLTRTTLFTTPAPRPETPMDRTTRAVTEIIDAQTEKREIKTARLRKARLEREAGTQVKAVAPKSKRVSTKSPAKAIK